ncbi:MAG: efflux transporter outer membrane subunit [bacterium]
MRINNLLLLVIATFAYSCSFVPEYVRPKSTVPDKLQAGLNKNVKEGVVNPQNISWKTFIKAEKLKKVIDLALEKNKDLKIAVLNVEKAKALYGVQSAALYPSVVATADMSKRRTPADLSSSGKATTATQYDINLGVVAWEIDFFGRLRGLKEAALEEFLATEEAGKAVKLSLISEVSRSYLNLAYLKSLYDTTGEILKNEEEIYKIIAKRFEFGLATEIDMLQSKSRIDSIKVELTDLKSKISMEENTLRLLSGNTVSEDLLPEDLKEGEFFSEFIPALSSEILLNRPDIQSAERRLKASNANIGAARSAFFPRISLTTTVGTASKELSGLFNSGSGAWLFMPQVSVPIFDPRTWSAYDAAKAEKELMIANYEKAIETAFKETADLLAVRENIDTQIRIQKDVLNSAEKAMDLATQRYLKGIDNYLRVLDAQRTVFSAKQKMLSLELIKLQNIVGLYKALGGGINY